MLNSKEILKDANIMPKLKLAIQTQGGGVNGTGVHRVKILADEKRTEIDRDTGKSIDVIRFIFEEDHEKKYYDVPGSRRLVLSLRPSSRWRWVGREGCPASCAHPQRVPLLPWCSTPAPAPRAPRSMPARVCTRLSLVRAVPSCVPISAAAPPLRLQGCKRFCTSLFSS